jgi:hypothetical protein
MGCDWFDRSMSAVEVCPHCKVMKTEPNCVKRTSFGE